MKKTWKKRMQNFIVFIIILLSFLQHRFIGFKAVFVINKKWKKRGKNVNEKNVKKTWKTRCANYDQFILWVPKPSFS